MRISMKKIAMPALTILVLVCMAFTVREYKLEADKAQLVSDWERAKAFSLEYVEAMPAEKINFKPENAPRSFAEQMLHLSSANMGFVANATGATPSVENPQELENNEDLKNKEALTDMVTKGYDFAIASITAMEASKLGENIMLFGQFDIQVATALDKAFEHQTHHRGQTTIYLRMAGVVPPNEKLF